MVGGDWRLAVRGWWRLAAVGGGWRLVIGGGWQWVVVGGWSPLAVGLGLVVPGGRSLRAMLRGKKKLSSFRTALEGTREISWNQGSELSGATIVPQGDAVADVPLPLIPGERVAAGRGFLALPPAFTVLRAARGSWWSCGVPRWPPPRVWCACYCWPHSATHRSFGDHRAMEGAGCWS